MKKLLCLISTFSFGCVPITSVLACSNGESGVKQDIAEQIASINSLSSNLVKSAGIKVKYNFSKSEYEQLLDSIGISNLYNDSKGNGLVMLNYLKNNMASIYLANQFLFDISSKIPGYDWIYQKLRWQSNKIGLLDFSNQDIPALTRFYNVMAGDIWLPSDNFGISVTFLKKDKVTGWLPTADGGDPAYARVNINKCISIDSTGIVDESKSSSGTIHQNPLNPTATISALTPSIDPAKGAIYQGWYTSSDLISLDGIFTSTSDSDEILPTNIFDYSISAFDWTNNFYNIGVNEILVDRQKEIENRITTHFENNPIYLAEDNIVSDTNDDISGYYSYNPADGEYDIRKDNLMKGQIKNRFANQILIELMNTCLDRKNIYKSDDQKSLLAFAETDSYTLLLDFQNTLKSLVDTDYSQLIDDNPADGYSYNYFDDEYDDSGNLITNPSSTTEVLSYTPTSGKDLTPINLTISNFRMENSKTTDGLYQKIVDDNNNGGVSSENVQKIVTFMNAILNDTNINNVKDKAFDGVNYTEVPRGEITLNSTSNTANLTINMYDLAKDDEYSYQGTGLLNGNGTSDCYDLGCSDDRRIVVDYRSRLEGNVSDDDVVKLKYDPDVPTDNPDPDPDPDPDSYKDSDPDSDNANFNTTDKIILNEFVTTRLSSVQTSDGNYIGNAIAALDGWSSDTNAFSATLNGVSAEAYCQKYIDGGSSKNFGLNEMLEYSLMAWANTLQSAVQSVQYNLTDKPISEWSKQDKANPTILKQKYSNDREFLELVQYSNYLDFNKKINGDTESVISNYNNNGGKIINAFNSSNLSENIIFSQINSYGKIINQNEEGNTFYKYSINVPLKVVDDKSGSFVTWFSGDPSTNPTWTFKKEEV